MVVVEEMNYLLVTDLAGQLVDVIAAVNQLADVTSDIAKPCVRGNNTFQTFSRSNRGTHVKLAVLSRTKFRCFNVGKGAGSVNVFSLFARLEGGAASRLRIGSPAVSL